MKLLRIVLVGLSAALLPGAAEASITITSNDTIAIVNDQAGGNAGAVFNGIAIPTSTTLDAVDGPNHSKNTIDWSTSGGQTILSFDMDHQRNGTLGSYAQTYDNVLNFTANSSAPYALSGYYHATDFGANVSRVILDASLYDTTANTYLFYNSQGSQASENEQFALGGTGGDNFNSLLGSLTGNLIGGHNYFLGFTAFIHAYPDADQGASAVGNITLTIGERSAAVPEPTQLLIWTGLIGLALGSIVVHRNRRVTRAVGCLFVALVSAVATPTPNAQASIQLAEFDVTNAISSSPAPIPVIGTAPGVLSSPLVPIGVNAGGASTPGLYWSSSWTTAATPNSFTQRLFFNLFANPGVTLSFDTLEFDVFSGGASLMGVELRVFGAGGSTIVSPQLLTAGLFSSPVNLATHVIADVSSLVPVANGDGYQFSLSFFNRGPTRIGLSGDRSDIGVLGGNMILTGQSSAVPEPTQLLIWTGLIGLALGSTLVHRARGNWTSHGEDRILARNR
jgi:hypothetical protein